jgi:hypothetical protein
MFPVPKQRLMTDVVQQADSSSLDDISYCRGLFKRATISETVHKERFCL